MARASDNDIFLKTSFLYGGNAAYLEDLEARYEQNPSSVDEGWRSFFAALKEEKGDAVKNAKGASWKQPGWPVQMNGELVAALDGNWIEVEKSVGQKIKAEAKPRGVELTSEAGPAGDARFGQGADDDPRLSHARASARQARSPGAGAALGAARTRSRFLRFHRGRSRSQDFHRPRARARIRERARDGGDSCAHLLPDDRRRVHAHLLARGEGLDSGAHRRPGQGNHLHARGQARDPEQARSKPRASRSSST